jgi:hypothetical protein
MMPVSHDDIMAGLPPERRARIEARTRELLAAEADSGEPPLSGLVAHAVEEYRQGRTTNIRDFAKEIGVDLKSD